MLEVLEIVAAIPDLIRKWRAVLCATIGLLAAAFALAMGNNAIERIGYFAVVALLGFGIGHLWQKRHERTRR